LQLDKVKTSFQSPFIFRRLNSLSSFLRFFHGDRCGY